MCSKISRNEGVAMGKNERSKGLNVQELWR